MRKEIARNGLEAQASAAVFAGEGKSRLDPGKCRISEG
jgi:hypothetical protein